MGRKGDLSVFEGGLVVGARRAVLSEKEEISGEATVWMRMPCWEVRGEWADWVEKKERQE